MPQQSEITKRVLELPRYGLSPPRAQGEPPRDRQARFVDCAARLVVHRTGHMGMPVPNRTILKVYGGRYDRVLRRYVRGDDKRKVVPDRVESIKCHEGQVRFLTVRKRGLKWVMGVGAMGAGKSMSGATRLLLELLDGANTTWGAIGPTLTHVDANILAYFLALVVPLGWLDVHAKKARAVRLVNNGGAEFYGAEKRSTEGGYSFQGRNWDGCVVDEGSKIEAGAHGEIAGRGRTKASRYVVYECTVFDDYPDFTLRIERLRLEPEKYLIIWYHCDWNCFIEVEAHLANLRSTLSHRDYRRLVLLIEDAPERRVYSHFRLGVHVRPVPTGALDVTERVTKEVLGVPYKYVMGQDFGAIVTCTIVLKCFELPGKKGQRHWWAVDEITSRYLVSSRHARKILHAYADPDDFVVLADPHTNMPGDADASDYTMFRDAGINVHRAATEHAVKKNKISIRQRISMVNSLLEDANVSPERCREFNCSTPGCAGHGEAHLFVDAKAANDPACRDLANAFLRFQLNEHGQAKPEKKDEKHDLTHWVDAVGYGLWRFERARVTGIEVVRPEPQAPWYAPRLPMKKN